MTNTCLSVQGKKWISSFSIETSYIKTLKLNLCGQKVSVSQTNANSIAIFRYNATLSISFNITPGPDLDILEPPSSPIGEEEPSPFGGSHLR